MIWQDWVFSACNILLNISLVPTILSKTNKPERSTCLLYFVSLWIISLVELTLNLPVSSTLTFLATLGWYILWQQERVYPWKTL